ncbi:MAG TPA: amino acid adenylation domain-containing protein, partial [Thermoanaerobaculia bacterium]|nr:amino acid adenylation domain-containing protein [Thermoanaerobaculia bacterium]
ALRVEGPLDRAVLALCLGEVVRRHEALRTVFAAPEGSPVQVIQPPAPFALSVVDLSRLPASRREATALALAGGEAGRPFDLARGPLLRGVLLRMAEDDHVVALTMHHIVSDGWSMGILVREVTALYAAMAEGRPSPLPELPVQYADFAVWQHSWLHGDLLESELSYWRRQLATLPPLLELPTDRPRPAVQSFRGAARPVWLSAGLTRQLQALSRREGATLFMVLLAGFQALLARYSGQQELAVGTPAAGRGRVEIEGLIGFFVNTLVLRGDLSGEPSFRELLGRVRETALAAHTHQDVPFEKLVQELAPERSLAHAPLFQVMFVLQNAPVASLEIQDLRLRPVSGVGTTAKFDLTLSLEEQNGGLAGTVEHATDLFDATTIDRLLRHFERLLAAAAARPDLSVLALPFLSPAERGQIVVEWNDTEPASAPPACLHELFEVQARRTPEAVAVVFGDQLLTYEELDRRSNQLARYLTQWEVGRGVLVGLFVERSVEMILGILGVLKAGGAYLPLDPSYPMERLAFMLKDSGVRVVLTQDHLAGALPAFLKSRIPLDSSWDAIAAEADGALNVAVEPEDLAYVIYTSGSTGRPKGVMVPHRGLANLSAAQVELFGLGVEDRVLQFAALSFDAAVWEIAMALGSGATLVLAARLSLLPGPELYDLLRASRINVVTLPPSALAALPSDAVDELPALRILVVAGEAFPPELARRWWQGRRLFNAYGPTEASVCATAQLYQGESRLPIGRPIGNVEAYVLDRQGTLSPIGSPGELCLGGLGLARGYMGRPELTAARFVPHPLAGTLGERLYRTGDLVRWLADGTLEFLDRLDQQVKVRGFRIELGEIESVLSECLGVHEAAVVAPADRSGQRTLIAYVVPLQGAVPSTSELRADLKERLPGFMVPSHIRFVDRLPLTISGKIDRRALEEKEEEVPIGEISAARTPEEEILAGIFAEVLRRSEVGVDESFFDLGGHSLLATQVISRIREALGVKLPLTAIFVTPTVSGLAASTMEARRREGVSPLPSITKAPRDQHLSLSYAQQRLWFLAQLHPDSAAYNLPMAIRFEGPLNAAALEAALGEVVRRHEVLRTTFPAIGGQPVQRIAPAPPLRVPCVDLSALGDPLREGEIDRLVRQEAERPFDLERGPLLRATRLHAGS